MCSKSARRPYPSDVSDEEWSLVAPYITLMTETAPQRDYPMRELFNALRYVVRYGIAWRAMPNDFPPWAAVYQQTQRWLAAGCFEALAQDLRALLRLAAGRKEDPTAAIIDSRTLRSTPESGPRAGYDGAKRKRGSKVHLAVDTLGHLLALHVTPANVGDRDAVARLAADIQEATGDTVKLAYVDQGYTGETPAKAAAAEGIELEVVKLPEAKRGFVLLPRRWVVERSFAWATRCRRLVKDYERYPETLAGLHVVAFPSVPMMMRHRPPGSLPLRARKDYLSHAHALQGFRRGVRGRCHRRPEADGGAGPGRRRRRIFRPSAAADLHRGR